MMIDLKKKKREEIKSSTKLPEIDQSHFHIEFKMCST